MKGSKKKSNPFKVKLDNYGEPTIVSNIAVSIISEVLDDFFLEHHIDKQKKQNELSKLHAEEQHEFLKLLMKAVEFKRELAKAQFTETRIGLLQKSIDNFDKLSPQWQGYITLSFANEETVMPERDAQLNEFLNKLTMEEKEQLVRKIKIENDLSQWKFDENKKRE